MAPVCCLNTRVCFQVSEECQNDRLFPQQLQRGPVEKGCIKKCLFSVGKTAVPALCCLLPSSWLPEGCCGGKWKIDMTQCLQEALVPSAASATCHSAKAELEALLSVQVKSGAFHLQSVSGIIIVPFPNIHSQGQCLMRRLKAAEPHLQKQTSAAVFLSFLLLIQPSTLPQWCLSQRLLAQYTEELLMLAVDSWVLKSFLFLIGICNSMSSHL